VLLGVLTAVQFCHILDFVIIMPLGPQLMRAFDIPPRQFGLLVSAYTFSAAVSGFLAALVMDRFDRKRTLLFLLAGFGVGTFLCGVAGSFALLMAARVAAGAFGGVLAGVVMAAIGDQFPPERRGMATGVVMSGFSVASVLGLPFGLFLAAERGWQAPFVLLSVVTAAVLAVAAVALPPMRAHVAAPADRLPVLAELAATVREPVHARAMAFTVALIFAGFSLIPFLSPVLVNNVGLRESDLAYVYLAGGIATLFTSPFFGRLADRFGAERVFVAAAVASLPAMIAITLLPRMGLAPVLALTTVFMVLAGGRWVAAMALMTGAVDARRRGSFMSLNASVQQLSAGAASLVAGWMIGGGTGGRLVGYPRVGVLAAGSVVVALFLVGRLGRSAKS
jgi:predicted MFS family arabinose efflux permease